MRQEYRADAAKCKVKRRYAVALRDILAPLACALRGTVRSRLATAAVRVTSFRPTESPPRMRLAKAAKGLSFATEGAAAGAGAAASDA